MGTRLQKNFDEISECFHSINVPSEWGLFDKEIEEVGDEEDVSIQLRSPATGDSIEKW